jgi:26S proteasome regulatory subunit N13
LKGSGGGQDTSQDPFTTLLDLLSPNTTLPVIDKAPPALIDALCANLPPMILLLAQEIDDLAEVDPTSETAQAAIEALDQDGKKDILKRVLRSPQMRQSLGSLTVALRDGGLPNISQALKIDTENGGYMRGGGMPLGGGDAVKAFVEGVKKTVEKDQDDSSMDTS